MKHFGQFIVKYRKIILIIGLLLLIPAVIGYIKTKVNYDILVYLPDDIETIQGENILQDDFGMGSYSVVVLENMKSKEILDLENKIKQIDQVSMCISTADVLGTKVPIDFLPDEIKNKAYKDGTTLMVITFKEGISDDDTLLAIKQLREIAGDKAKYSGMSAIVIDTKELSDSEMMIYVVISAILCIIILQISLDSYFAPFLLILNIGIAIIYNMGSNIFLGEISYITKAISAVLQLGVTTDFAIFLYHSFIEEKENGLSKEDAMASAINKTLVSVLGSSLTTIAGFLALCSMRFSLGKDIGIVMAKGVLMGVICVVTILPALILECDKSIGKTKHKIIFPKFIKLKEFIINHYWLFIAIFIIVLPIAFHGYRNTDIYYNLDRSLPRYLPSIEANTELKEKYNMVSTELLLVNKDLPDETINKMIKEIENVDGIEWAVGVSKLKDLGIPKEMLPKDVLEKLETDKYQLVLINSLYEMATDELNNQVNVINELVDKYDKTAILVGEGPLMKDLVEISNHDFNSVNTFSIGVIFVIMIFVLKSASLPFILIAVIEFAIFINMGIPYYSGTVLPFIASIVIGTIQLGATIDYAILITTKYIGNRKDGKSKRDSIDNALETSISSIFISGLCFFGATIGVGIYSKIEMIGSLCVLMGRGAIISMFTVVCLLPAFLMVFDKLICKTTSGMKMIFKKEE